MERLICHAEPEGVSKVARELAKELAMPLHLHFLDMTKMRGAWHHRSIAVLKDCDRAILIHDGVSKGTANELKLCIKLKKPHTLHTISPTGDPASDSAGLSEWLL